MTDYENCIVDQPLPLALDVEALRDKGIKYLQSIAADVWTNYNESDPGITILDQLCYALTELGYCAQFPIEDMLTQESGDIHYHDQFFEPQNILTGSPVTPDDYRKLVLDTVAEVRVIYIEPETVNVPMASTGQNGLAPAIFTGRYNSYLSITGNVDRAGIEAIIQRVYVLLNQHRNLGELFLPPIQLQSKNIELGGRIFLTQSADAAKVRALIAEALLEVAQPVAVKSGYSELRSQGMEADQIFNGPKLTNGWIAGWQSLKNKCQSVNLCSLTSLIENIDGVLLVESLCFAGAKDQTEIVIDKTAIANIELSAECQLVSKGMAGSTPQNSSKHRYLAALRSTHKAANVQSKIDLYPGLPTGRYRDIENYYSVQNTFPDIYGIGYNSLRSDASSYRVAVSRQMKGYLMSFDQLLANQFSQLAHISDLFSFHCREGSSVRSEIAHEKFATTYYYQPLYNIPDVKPLLLGNDAFHYQFDPDIPEQQANNEAWKQYQEFPFNKYIHGLRQCMEGDAEATARRDAMLSHLMARHGDDAGLYDEMIENSQWFGSELKTRVIVKTIWLQNYQLLSYNRSRAFDFISTDKLLPPGDPNIVNTRPGGGGVMPQPRSLDKDSGEAPQPWWRKPSYPVFDGEVDQARIYSEARLKPSDLSNFSAFELKAGILLGLPARWKILAGKLMALLDAPDFEEWLHEPAGKPRRFSSPDSDIFVIRSANHVDHLYEGEQCLMDIVWPAESTPPTKAYYQAHADQLLWLATQSQGFLLLESILLLQAQHSAPPTSKAAPYFLKAYLLFPGYITFVQQPKFFEFFTTLFDFHWPAHVARKCLPIAFRFLHAIIPVYVKRNNSFDDPGSLKITSMELAKLLGLPSMPANGLTTS